jgi:hypothetical protein
MRLINTSSLVHVRCFDAPVAVLHARGQNDFALSIAPPSLLQRQSTFQRLHTYTQLDQDADFQEGQSTFSLPLSYHAVLRRSS